MSSGFFQKHGGLYSIAGVFCFIAGGLCFFAEAQFILAGIQFVPVTMNLKYEKGWNVQLVYARNRHHKVRKPTNFEDVLTLLSSVNSIC